MSRGYNARRKAERQNARRIAKAQPHDRARSLPSPFVVLPLLAVVAILATVAILGFGGNSGVNRAQVDEEVTDLLVGIPQHGSTLGAPKAPITIKVFADLECPTVRSFVTQYLPSIIDPWVRNGYVKLQYRSLHTDTLNEHTFFRQEEAALAAGKQNRMWNFILTFIHEQGEEYTGYATDAFLTDIASQVPGLSWANWRRAREDLSLFDQVAGAVHAAQLQGLRTTPSFVISPSDGQVDWPAASSSARASMARNIETQLAQDVTLLRKETAEDRPALHRSDYANRKEVEELTAK